MRILFVSGVDVGGAPRSTVQLARRLVHRGHDVGILMGRANQFSWAPGILYKAAIKLRLARGWLWPRELVRPFGAKGKPPIDDGGVLVWRRPHPANAMRSILKAHQPDVVVANSLPREQLRWILADAHAAKVRVALYMRETHSITHLTDSKLDLDLVLANSLYLAEEATKAGYVCPFIPSIVDLTASDVESTRESVVLVNPVPENRPEIMQELAAARPDIKVVLQESWPLDDAWRDELTSWTEHLPNLTLRRRCDSPSDVYRDARLVVAPYPSGRPRVVLEAQHNAIPVVAMAQPALIEAVGDGGVLLPLHAENADWVVAISRAWDDAEGYAALTERAVHHSHREEVDPESVTLRFEQALRQGGKA